MLSIRSVHRKLHSTSNRIFYPHGLAQLRSRRRRRSVVANLPMYLLMSIGSASSSNSAPTTNKRKRKSREKCQNAPECQKNRNQNCTYGLCKSCCFQDPRQCRHHRKSEPSKENETDIHEHQQHLYFDGSTAMETQ